jgi:translation initiation factor 2-alpha kinase 4
VSDAIGCGLEQLMFMHFRFPKTYPTLVCPMFSVVKPTAGIDGNQILALSQGIHAEAQRHKGAEMVFQVRPS